MVSKVSKSSKKSSKIKQTQIVGNVVIIVGALVTWWLENQEKLSGILDATTITIIGLVIGGFNAAVIAWEKVINGPVKSTKTKKPIQPPEPPTDQQ